MEWKYNALKQSYELKDKDLLLAFLACQEKAGVKYPFRVKVGLSSLYLGQKKQKALLRKSKEWFIHKRQFASKSESEHYINLKKKDFWNFVLQQESIR
jgi:hypothetical protein